VRLAAGYLSYLQRRPKYLWSQPEAEPYRVTLAILQSFQREAENVGADFAPILVFPTEDALSSVLDGKERYWAGMLEDLAVAGVPYLDLSIALARYCKSSGDRARAVFAGGHLNPAGNQVVAEAVLAFLRRKR
jgi:lysophospholipase L1-like esterase